MDDIVEKLRKLAEDLIALELDMKLPPKSLNPHDAADLIASLRSDNDALGKLAEEYANQRDALANENFVRIGGLEIANGQLRSDNARLAKELEEARKALEPFASFKTADGLPCGFLRIPDEHPMLFNGLGDSIEFVVTVDDFRRASAIRHKATVTTDDLQEGGSDD